MMRRGLWFLILLSILLASEPALCIPSHENFNDAPQDLYAITGFLTDITELSEQSLSASLDARCTIQTNQSIEKITYSEKSLNRSLLKIEELKKRISYSDNALNTLKGKASSYDYLKNILLPIKELGLNVSSFVRYHHVILTNFSMILAFISQGKNETEAVQALGTVKSAIYSARINLSRVEQRAGEMSETFPTETLQDLIPRLYTLLSTYDQYSDDLVSLYYGVEPHLLVFLEEPTIYLGEEVHTYGYFIAARTFVTNQRVMVQFDDTIRNVTNTNDDGLYESNISIPVEFQPGTYGLVVSTFYNGTMYYSSTVSVIIQKIPTSVTLFSNKTHAYVREQIGFYGKLVDHNMVGIQANITFHIGEQTFEKTTDPNGSYTFVFQDPLAFGVYHTFISYNPSEIYEPSRSSNINITIDTPTTLSLSLPQTTVPLGEMFLVNGRLTSSITHQPMEQKTIDVLMNGKQIGAGTTNKTGWYSIRVSTADLHEGPLSVYTMYQSDSLEWRTATSPHIELTIGPAVFYFIPYLVIVIFLIIAGILYLARKKIRVRKKTHPLLPSTTPADYGVTRSRLPMEAIQIDEKEFIIDITGKKSDEFRDAIVSRYRSFITRLSTTGFTFPISSTHLDIKQEMITHGLSKKSTEMITSLFELAMYSPYPLGKKEVTLFNNHVRTLIKNLGGSP